MLIGSKLPFGLKLELTDADGKPVIVEVLGLNSSRVIGADHMTTEVDADFWDAWVKLHPAFPAVVSGTIFAVKSARDAAAASRDAGKTGMEPLKPDDKSNGVQTAKD